MSENTPIGEYEPNQTTIRTTRMFSVSTDDPEISAIEVMLMALRDLDVDTQRRVLNYLADRAESDAKKVTR